MRPLLVALLLLLALHRASATSVPLTRVPPQPHVPGSSRGFPTVLRFFDREPRDAHWLRRWVRRALRRPAVTVRTAVADLHGGITAVGEYYLRVKVGGQDARVQVDTGSSTMAIPVKGCDSCRSGDLRFDPASSNSGKFRKLGCATDECGSNSCSSRSSCGRCSDDNACCAKEDPESCAFELKYGDGSGARGALVEEVVEIAPGVASPVIFGGILHDSSDFERPSVDGILGMAYKDLACTPTCVEPPFDAMVRSGVVDKDMFSLCMTDEGGALVLGDYDPSMGKGEPQWVDNTGRGYYSVSVGGSMIVGEQEVALPQFNNGIVDSGTTLIVLSQTSFQALLGHLTQNYCNVPNLCDEKTWFQPASCVDITPEELAMLPSLTINLGEVKLKLEPEDYMVKYKDKGKEYRCVGFMTEDPVSNVQVILGNTVMLKYITIHDRENHRVGFMEKKGDCGNRAKGEAHKGPGSSTAAPTGEGCGAKEDCESCAADPACAFNHKTKECSSRKGHPTLSLYPYCSGRACLCGVEGFVSPVILVAGGLFAAFVLFAGLATVVRCVRNRSRYRSGVYRLQDEHDLFDDEDEDFN